MPHNGKAGEVDGDDALHRIELQGKPGSELSVLVENRDLSEIGLIAFALLHNVEGLLAAID
jgi:hypothetical protein